MVDFQRTEGLVRNVLCNDAIRSHIREIPHTAEHSVRDTRRAAAAPCDLIGALRHD